MSARRDAQPDNGATPRLAGPLYFQIRELMRQRIGANEWSGGRYLPNEGDLAREYGVSIGTMRKALDLLGQEKLIVRRQGLGTYVNDTPAAAELHLQPWPRDGQSAGCSQREIQSSSAVEPNAVEAADLAMGPASQAIRLHAVCTDPTRTVSAEVYLIPRSLVPKESGVTMNGAQAEQPDWPHIVSSLEQRVKRYRDSVSVTIAPLKIAETLGIAAGTPILRVYRIARDAGDRPVFICERHLHPGAGNYIAVVG